MSKKHSKNLSDLIEALTSELSVADIMSSAVQARVCAAITKERVRLGMNQTQFADYLGVSQGMVSRWESSDYNFTIDTIAKIAAKLDLLFDISLTPSKDQASIYMHSSSKIIPFPKQSNVYHVENVELEEM